jgi:hypothetical protein
VSDFEGTLVDSDSEVEGGFVLVAGAVVESTVLCALSVASGLQPARVKRH